jgi:hypothetical protein
MNEENQNKNWLELIRTLNFPDWLIDNVVTVLGKGIYGIITVIHRIAA